MCICVAMIFTACSSESSVKTETTVSVSVNEATELMEKGNKNLEVGNYDEAIKNYSEALEMDDSFKSKHKKSFGCGRSFFVYNLRGVW